MTRKLRGLMYTVPGLVLGAFGASSCDERRATLDDWRWEFPCGVCGNPWAGDVNISGDASLDGFFRATALFREASVSVKGDFQANVRVLASTYGVPESRFVVDDLVRAIKADVAANTSAGIHVNYRPPACSVAVKAASRAQLECETASGCSGVVNPSSVSVKCDGFCSGACSGTCSGAESCVVNGSTVDCSGSCEGTCELSDASNCDGVCHGTCAGTCSRTDESGQCHGTCSDGVCQGACELRSRTGCAGVCHAYDFHAGIGAAAQAAFVARVVELETRGAAIIQGSARLSALIEGRVNGKAYFPKPPLVALTESIEALVSPDAIGGFNIPPGVYPCVLPGLTTAGKILDDVRFDVSSTLADQATFVTYITNPT